MGHGPARGPVDVGDRSFDHYTRLARRLLGTPVALVSLVEPERQVFPGSSGLPGPDGPLRETPISHSFCQYVVSGAAPLVVPDAREHPVLADNPAVADLRVVAYAGWPVTDTAGRVVGSLCAIDAEPREWSADDLAALEDLAAACSTELQHAEALVAESEQLARTILGAVDVAMAFYDDEHRLVLANERAERIAAAAGFRLDRPPYAGPEVRRADRRAVVPLDEQVIPRALRGELQHHQMEWMGAPGEQTAVVASSQALRRPDGRPWGIIVAMHDVTELARVLELRERFTATVSHELRTPLTAILGYLELVVDDVQDPRVAQTLARITRSALTLQGRVDGLLETAERRHHLDLRPTDLSALVLRVHDSISVSAVTTGVEVRADGSDAHWATVDAARVEQAVENLVSNAVKYTDGPGVVRVVVRGLPDAVEVAVSDDGIGMSAEEVDQAFDLYWRAPRAREGTAHGVGLGLSLVRQVATEHHGRVHIDSAAGLGTTVTLTLPRVPA